MLCNFTMKSFISIFIFFATTTLALEFPVQDCGSRRGSYSNVSLSCPGSDECILKRNTNVSMTIVFTPTEECPTVKAVVHGVIQGIPVPFPIPNPDACSSLECPLKKNKSYSYSVSFPIRSSYPKVSVKVKWELQDDNKEDIICVLIPARIQ